MVPHRRYFGAGCAEFARTSFARANLGYNVAAMVHDDEKLALDTERLNVLLTGLQAEVEAKVRRVQRFREQMRKIDSSVARVEMRQREKAARALIAQVDDMIETNLIVRDTLHELRETAEAVLKDLLE
jgi:hypothetical protein